MMKCDAVFEGGGVKGIGLVGAVSVLEERGYEFVNLVGTSVGAIVASLLAVGYRASEIREAMTQVDFRSFQGKTFLNRLSVLGDTIKIISKYGSYSADPFEQWLTGLLAAKGKTVFGDIRMPKYMGEKYKYKFQAVASDLTDRAMLVLPGALARFGIDPDTFPIARAVRMSMSIPIYFAPVFLRDMQGETHIIVDGGLLSKYPIFLLDGDTDDPPWPTFGMRFVSSDERHEGEGHRIRCVAEYIKAIVSTAMDAHDEFVATTLTGDSERTIFVPCEVTLGGKAHRVKTTEFSIKPAQAQALYQAGADSATRFLENWDFKRWKRTYRQNRRFLRMV